MSDRRFAGRLNLEVVDHNGVVVDRRQAWNTVFLTGATLVADLFSGKAATPVNGMGVGTNPDPASAPYQDVTLDLNDEAGQPMTGATAVALSPDSIAIDHLPDEMRVRVSVRGVLPPEAARASDGGPINIAEAALGVLAQDGLSLARIYNRVTFDPVPKRPEHELALYWEVFFPYGP